MSHLSSSHTQSGFTIIEILITTFIIGTVVTGLFGLFVLGLRGAQEGERRIAAIALANERMEMIRNLPYAQVGTSGGVPGGSIAQDETLTRNGVPYIVRVDIRYVDDLYDGDTGAGSQEEEKIIICHKPGSPNERTLEVSAAAVNAHVAHGDTLGPCGGGDPTPPGDEYSADYKQVRVEVSWPSPSHAEPILLITYMVPQGIEGGDEGGILDFQALNVAGEGVENAEVTLINDEVDPAINVTTETNAEGRLVLPGLPESNGTYQISVTKDGYSTEQTFAQTADFIPLPDYQHLSMFVQQVTGKTFTIDQLANLNVVTQDETPAALPNIAYALRGTKITGQDGDGNDVYKVDASAQTNASGQATHAGLEGDTYDVTIDGVTTGYDIKETDPLVPLALNPADDTTLTLTLIPHTAISLQVTVVGPTGLPIDNATLQLTGVDFDDTQGTGPLGQVYFGDLPSNGDYTLNIDAPTSEPSSSAVRVENTTRVRVQLTPVS